ncbi:MAG: transposase [Gemmataceae bacterium]
MLEMVQGAGKKEVEALWQTLPEEHREQAAAMDRGKSMIAGALADIMHDRYHISDEQNKAVDLVRRAANKKLMTEGDDTPKGTRYTWLSGLDRLSDTAFANFEGLVQINLKTGRAWEIKTTFEGFWDHRDKASAHEFITKWKKRAVCSGLAVFVKLANSGNVRVGRNKVLSARGILRFNGYADGGVDERAECEIHSHDGDDQYRNDAPPGG